MIYAWQQPQWSQINIMHQQKKLPHAILFSGSKGLGKRDFATHFLQLLLCPSGGSSGEARESSDPENHRCHVCQLVLNKVHPNVLWIQPEKKGQNIKVDQIREINDFIFQSSFADNYRIAVIHPADQMNINAANALLKTLEEPPLGAIILLISDHSDQLPITILSRVQQIHFNIPKEATVIDFVANKLAIPKDKANKLLRLANGAPLAAIALSLETLNFREKITQGLYQLINNEINPIMLANDLLAEDDDIITFIDCCLAFMMDLLKIKLNIAIYHEDLKDVLLKIENNKDTSELIDLLMYLQQLRKESLLGINFNKQLLLENVFIRWIQPAKESEEIACF